MFAIPSLCLVMSPVLLNVMTSKKKETPLAKKAVRSQCHLELRNTCDIIQQALNLVSIRQEKTAWASKQDKNRMQNITRNNNNLCACEVTETEKNRGEDAPMIPYLFSGL